MKHFRVDNSFWALFPDVRIGVVVCKGISNCNGGRDDFARLLAGAEEQCREQMGGGDLAQNPYVAVWREALRRFRLEKGARSSVEAMARRILNGHHLSSINPLVDIYNSVSLTAMLPCGGEDLDRISGDMVLTRAEGSESFVPLGGTEDLPPAVGEVIYRDEAGAVVRGWLWREADRTKITADTTNALLYMELLDTERHADLAEALTELTELVTRYLGGHCRVDYLTRANPAVSLD